jgi:hypothetical protein
LNLTERRRDIEELTERKEVLGEGKSIAGEGSRPVEGVVWAEWIVNGNGKRGGRF